MRLENSTFLKHQASLIGLFVAIAWCMLLYWPGLSGPLLLDDGPQLRIFLAPSSPDSIQSLDYLFSQSGQLGRPVAMLTFILNYELTGQGLFNWKLTNLIIHVLIGALIYLLGRRLIIDSGAARTEQAAGYWALLVAAVWLLHPLQVSTVLYLVQRMSQLSTLFVVAGMLCYVIARSRQVRGHGGHYLLWVSVLVFLPLAAFSKENGVLLLLFIPLTEIFIYRFQASPEQKKQLQLFFIACIAVPLLFAAIYLILNFDRYVLSGYDARPYDLVQRLLTQARVLVMYLTQIIIPNPNLMTFFYDDYVVSKSVLEPRNTLWSLVVIAGLLLCSWMIRIRFPLLAFGIWFFFAAHLMESTIFPLELVFEHRNYLPMLGIVLALVTVLAHTIPGNWWRYAAPGFILVVLSLTLAVRAQTWSNEASLYSFMYEQRPGSARVASAIAELFTNHDHLDAAIEVLRDRPDNGAILQKLYIECLRDGYLPQDRLKVSLDRITSPIDLYAVTGVIELSNMRLDSICDFDTRMFNDFIQDLRDNYAMRRGSRYKIGMYVAHLYWHLEEHETAIVMLDKLFSEHQRSASPMYLAAEWAVELGEIEKAQEFYRAANLRAQNSWSIYRDMDEGVYELIMNRARQ